MTDLIQFIISCLSAYYQIEVTMLALLPVGADMNASVYKAQATNQETYFIKLKQDQDVNVAILELLQSTGIQQLIPPVKTIEGKLAQKVGDFTLVVYPFIQGTNGFVHSLTNKQWFTLGKALRQVHEIDVPTSMRSQIRQEDFSPKWREALRSLYAHIETAPVDDTIALNLWKFLKENRPIIQKLLDHSEELSQKARNQSFKFVLCHSDIHGGNILIDNKDSLYIVDWDDPILAPKERDLMFIGGGVGNVWNQPHEEKLFYQGYGQTNVNQTLLAYYRHERIIEDIVLYSQELLLNPIRSKNRLELYQQFMDMFVPHGVVDIAFETQHHLIQ